MKDHVALARQYERDVISGATPACRQVRQACQRNVDDLDRQDSAGFPYVFDAVRAARICQAAELLPHVKGPKAKVVGYDKDGERVWNTIALEPWQCWILTTLFGWVQVASGLRRFRQGLVLVPRKNAKSTMGAIVALYMLTADGEMGPECYSAATTRDQAKVVAEIVWKMAKNSPEFRKELGVKMGSITTRSVEVVETGGTFRPLSAEAQTLDGLNVSCAVVDELHAHPKRDVWDVIITAVGARAQPLVLAITTAGVDTGGICHEVMGYLHRVLERTHRDESFFGINYTVDEGDDWRREATWQKANPNYGVSVFPEHLASEALKAEVSSAALNNFLTKHLNVWVRAESSWLPSEAWLAAADRSVTVDRYQQAPCYIGIDLAEVRDIAAVVLVFKPAADEYVILGRYYLPTATIRKSPVAQYSGWVHDGHLIATDGDMADFLRIEDDIYGFCQRLNVQKLCFDRALSTQMSQSLGRRLGPSATLVEVRQNVDVMNPAMQTVERLLLAGKLRHDGNPCMTWMMANVVVERNYRDEIFPRKAGGKDSPNKIDGAVALFTAMTQAVVEQPETDYSMFFLGGRRR